MSGTRIVKMTGQGEIRLYDADNSHYQALRANATVGSSHTLTFPAAIVADSFLKTDGSGNLSWGTDGTASLQSAYNVAPGITIGAGGAVDLDRAAGGEVLKVRASASGNPYIAVVAGTTEVRFGAVRNGVATIDAQGVDLQLRRSGLEVFTVKTTEVVVPVTYNYSAKDALSAVHNLMSINANGGMSFGNTSITAGGSGQGDLVFSFSGNSMFGSGGLGLVAPTDKLNACAATTSAICIRTVTNPETTAERQILRFACGGVANPAGTNETGRLEAVITQANPSNLKSRMEFSLNAGDSVRKVFQLGEDDVSAGTNGVASHFGKNGNQLNLRQKEMVVTTSSGGSASATGAIPAGCIVLGVTIRIITTVTGPTTVDIGVSGALQRYIVTNTFSVGTTQTSLAETNGASDAGGSFKAPRIYNAATDIIFTANGGNFTAGQWRLIIDYIDLTPPTA